MSRQLLRGMAVVGVCAAIVACAKGENKADSAAAADSAAKANAAATPPPAPAAALTDANILALLDEVNAADSAAGNVASSKGTAASVKEFGKQMMRDHHALRKGGQDLAKKMNVTPQPPANDSLPAMAKGEMDKLASTPKGADFDKAYIDAEVGVHQFAVTLLTTAQGAAQDSSLKDAITKAIPMIQAHLAKAQDIQGKLSSAPAADTTKGATKKK